MKNFSSSEQKALRRRFRRQVRLAAACLLSGVALALLGTCRLLPPFLIPVLPASYFLGAVLFFRLRCPVCGCPVAGLPLRRGLGPLLHFTCPSCGFSMDEKDGH